MPDGDTFHSVRVDTLRRETDDALSVVLAIPEALKDAFAYRPGQFVSVRIPTDGGEITRSYSLSSSPVCDPAPAFTVRLEPNGRGSGWLHRNLRPGDSLRLSAPQGRFVVAEGGRPVQLIAAGSGITPCFSMIRTLLATSDRRIALHYASRTATSVIFRADLEALRAQSQGRFSCRFHISGAHGAEARAVFFRDLRPLEGADHYICGSPGFVEDVAAHLAASGVREDAMRHEAFASPPDEAAIPAATPAAAGGMAAILRITLDGAEAIAPVLAGQSLLDAALAAGLDVPNSCRSGVCGSCMAKLRDGAVDQKPGSKGLSRRDSEKGMVLACQSRAVSASVWLDYDF